jgi:hypothetical protein
MKLNFLLFALCPLLFAQAAEKPFTMLTDELLAKLPEAQRSEWTAYIAQSRTAAANEHRILDAERTQAEAKPAPGNRAEFEHDNNTPAEWFASAENQKGN